MNAIPDEDSDGDLCARVGGGDQQALATLYDRHSARAFARAFRIVRSREDAEDVVQAAFLKLWNASNHYSRHRGPFGPWFMRLVTNLALDEVRRDSSRLRLQSGITAQLSAAAQVGDHFEEVARRLASAAVGHALWRLPSAQRDVIWQAYFGGRTLAEIAAAASVPVSTIKGRMRLGLERLRAETLGLA